jgi:hypothetical protein
LARLFKIHIKASRIRYTLRVAKNEFVQKLDSNIFLLTYFVFIGNQAKAVENIFDVMKKSSF